MEGYVATIGMFDGVHRGHQFVLRHVVACAQQRGLGSLAVTFDHTLHRDRVLTPLDEKQRRMLQTGIDRVVVLPFTDELRNMTARDFMDRVLRRQLGVRVLLTGYDNRFGHNREEGFDDYVRYGLELGIEVVSLPPAPTEGGNDAVSSSLIRQLLTDGRVAEAADALGLPYALEGRVTHGEHIGTSLGFPTANLQPTCPNQLVPAAGVYAVRVLTEGDATWRQAMMNIGRRPTFNGHHTTLEVHLLHFSHDLYGQRLTVAFVSWLRAEQRFDSPEALRRQLEQDARQAAEALRDT